MRGCKSHKNQPDEKCTGKHKASEKEEIFHHQEYMSRRETITNGNRDHNQGLYYEDDLKRTSRLRSRSKCSTGGVTGVTNSIKELSEGSSGKHKYGLASEETPETSSNLDTCHSSVHRRRHRMSEEKYHNHDKEEWLEETMIPVFDSHHQEEKRTSIIRSRSKCSTSSRVIGVTNSLKEHSEGSSGTHKYGLASEETPNTSSNLDTGRGSRSVHRRRHTTEEKYHNHDKEEWLEETIIPVFDSHHQEEKRTSRLRSRSKCSTGRVIWVTNSLKELSEGSSGTHKYGLASEETPDTSSNLDTGHSSVHRRRHHMTDETYHNHHKEEWLEETIIPVFDSHHQTDPQKCKSSMNDVCHGLDKRQSLPIWLTSHRDSFSPEKKNLSEKNAELPRKASSTVQRHSPDDDYVWLIDHPRRESSRGRDERLSSVEPFFAIDDARMFNGGHQRSPGTNDATAYELEAQRGTCSSQSHLRESGTEESGMHTILKKRASRHSRQRKSHLMENNFTLCEDVEDNALRSFEYSQCHEKNHVTRYTTADARVRTQGHRRSRNFHSFRSSDSLDGIADGLCENREISDPTLGSGITEEVGLHAAPKKTTGQHAVQKTSCSMASKSKYCNQRQLKNMNLNPWDGAGEDSQCKPKQSYSHMKPSSVTDDVCNRIQDGRSHLLRRCTSFSSKVSDYPPRHGAVVEFNQIRDTYGSEPQPQTIQIHRPGMYVIPKEKDQASRHSNKRNSHLTETNLEQTKNTCDSKTTLLADDIGASGTDPFSARTESNRRGQQRNSKACNSAFCKDLYNLKLTSSEEAYGESQCHTEHMEGNNSEIQYNSFLAPDIHSSPEIKGKEECPTDKGGRRPRRSSGDPKKTNPWHDHPPSGSGVRAEASVCGAKRDASKNYPELVQVLQGDNNSKRRQAVCNEIEKTLNLVKMNGSKMSLYDLRKDICQLVDNGVFNSIHDDE